ncbi:uncharacterized protein LOC121915020 [Sceloporus undulatus]|uniref:uncharacterized protein LOC121915020 n=1 Tax=Sceloporus undulatus TaxID=8520 RepID=UPI001C4BE78A|nr:uncharacterized protein LOC121915020 [Sceloporus undulatus]XP_042294772.1 uncharacterized protein LOC121915020 [Sceloporus undulatus]
MDFPCSGLPFLLFLLWFPGTANLPAKVRHVDSTLGGSVLFPITISSMKTVAEIEWKFETERGLALLIAEFSDGKLVRPNPRDRFGQRLEMVDETTLKIKDLEREDSGVYMARVMLATFTVLEYFFNLTVYSAINDPVGIPFRQVSGVLGRSVLLSISSISPSDEIGKIEWDFQPQNGTGLYIAEFKDGKLECPNPKDHFGMRLELENETTLRIRNLEEEDSGVYRARVRLLPAKIEEYSFRLTVYDPVPEPQILLLQETPDSLARCNVTLWCLVSEKGGLNVSWRTGDAFKPLEEDLDWYRFSSEGWSLHLSNLSNPMDSSVTCLVSNLADQKSASINLTNACSHPGPRSCFSWVRITFAIGLVFKIAIVTFLNLLERKDRVHS